MPPNLTWTPPFARKTPNLRRELETDVVHTYTHARAQKCTCTQAHTPCQLPLCASRACDPLRSALCLCWQGRATYGDHERERGFWEWRGGSFGMREHTRVRVILRLLHHGHRCHKRKAPRCVCFGGHARVHSNHDTCARAVCAREQHQTGSWLVKTKRASGVHARARGHACSPTH